MGVSTDAMLLYGYDLGSGEEWKIEGVDQYGVLERAWLGEDDEFSEAAMRVLLASIGFTETDWQVEGFFRRQREAEERLVVSLESHCSDEYPMWVLAAQKVVASRGTALVVDFAELDAQRQAGDWDDKLRAALEALGITPTQAEPCWLLASNWG